MPRIKTMPKKKARLAKAMQRLNQTRAINRDTYALARASVQRATAKMAKAQSKRARLNAKGARIDAKLTAAETGVWGTRTIRTKYWQWRQNRLIDKMLKHDQRIDSAKARTQALQEKFATRFDHRIAQQEAKTARAKAQFDLALNKAAIQIQKVQAMTAKRFSRIRTLNNNRPAGTPRISNRILNALENKINSEAANADAHTGAFRLLEIDAGLAGIQQQVTRGQIALARREAGRLTRFNDNPP